MTTTRNATDRDDSAELTPQQTSAVDLLAGGGNVTDTARSIGVARQTVSRWVHSDAQFRAALNVRREETGGDLVLPPRPHVHAGAERG